MESSVNTNLLNEIGAEMNAAYITLQESLDDFNSDRIDYQSTLDSAEEE